MMLVSMSPLIGLAIAAISLGIVARMISGRFWLSIFLSIGIGLMAGFSLLAFATIRAQYSAGIFDYLYFMLTYGGLSFCFFHFNNLGETSIRFRIIRECLRNNNRIALGNLRSLYGSDQIVELRLKRLLLSKKITIKSDRYFANSILFVIMTKLIYGTKRIIFGRERIWLED